MSRGYIVFKDLKTCMFQALNEIGTKTSVLILQANVRKIIKAFVIKEYQWDKEDMELIEFFLDKTSSYQNCVRYRTEYKKLHNDTTKNTTYKGQPARNMLKDTLMNDHQIARMQFFLDNNPELDPNELKEALGLNTKTPFHSVKQLRNVITKVARKAA